MHAHAHWTDNEERIAWNGISRSLMAGQPPSHAQSSRVEALCRARGIEDAAVEDRGDYEDSLTDSRQCLLTILDSHSDVSRDELKPHVDALMETCRAAYEKAWGASPSPRR